MTRFQQEITGLLGAYWQQNAEKELKAAVESAARDATVDENGAISWKSNGSYLMDDFCEKLEFAGFHSPARRRGRPATLRWPRSWLSTEETTKAPQRPSWKKCGAPSEKARPSSTFWPA